ncbi:uncharacterized protein LOC143446399 [Clavelina lepadiformis]|uniref:uncharacterized protein LOC143446399 n=1 Tax=Clavelina lepadiformis TaxID=159417 RepID=UPI00404249C7
MQTAVANGASNNSNNVELRTMNPDGILEPLNGSRFQESDFNRKMSRRANTPLPAVPLPAKKNRPRRQQSALNPNPAHSPTLQTASCDDLSQITPRHMISEDVQKANLMRTASVDFDVFSRMTSMTQPLLADHNFQGYPPVTGTSATLRSMNTSAKYTPIHDYEELQEHERRVNTLRQQMPGNQLSSLSCTPQVPVSSPITPDTTQQYPFRERQNPMYSGMRAVSPFSNVLEGNSNQHEKITKSAMITKKCACALVAGLTVAIIISALSLMLVILFSMGIIKSAPLSRNEIEGGIKDLEAAIKAFEDQLQLQSFDAYQRFKQYNASLSDLADELSSMKKNKSVVRMTEIQRQLKVVVQSLTPEEINYIFGNLSGSALSRCRHETYSIGGSTSQEVINSGEYYTEEGYVITGVTCSSTEGFIGSIQTQTATLNGEQERTSYWCLCKKIKETSDTLASSPGRAECRIDYWECPTSPA